LRLPLVLSAVLTGRLKVDEDNLMRWNLGLMVVNPDSVFNGGYFKVSTIHTRVESSEDPP
jgi:ubiquitin-conjugating enzyme E2 R